jgi:hypothetical protein
MLHVSGRLHKLSFLRYECSLTPRHPIDVVNGGEKSEQPRMDLYDKEPSVMETHIARLYGGDAHDKTERSAPILVAQTASSKLVPAWDHGKEIRRPD